MMKTEQQRILVLGSAGLIGTALCKLLRDKGHTVIEYDIKNDLTQDLTNSSWNKQLQHSMWQADFVYFLAFDVGGSKYLGANESAYKFLHSNNMIMTNVFSSLQLCKTPFVFASSMMSGMEHSVYGQLKSLGEAYTQRLGGVSARYWNVFGYEDVSEKSHVVPDFCWQAQKEGRISIMTEGKEQRQFIHVNDAVCATDLLRENWGWQEHQSAPPIFDISNGHWRTIYDVAEKVSREFGGVPIVKGKQPDYVQREVQIEPNMRRMQSNPFKWKARRTMEQGIKLVADEVRKNAK